MKFWVKINLVLLTGAIFFSCVSKKKYADLKSQCEELQVQLDSSTEKLQAFEKKSQHPGGINEQPKSGDKFIRISLTAFNSDGDMIRKMITGQLDEIAMEELSKSLPVISISDLTGSEIAEVNQLIGENELPADTIQVASQIGKFSKIDERVILLDSSTNYAYYALPARRDDQKTSQFSSELDVTKIKTAAIPEKPVYRISVNGEYEYYDGRPISGTKSVQKKYKDGYKPISEVTFFYQAKKNGIIIEGISAREFLALSREEQKLLLHNAIMMINEQTKN